MIVRPLADDELALVDSRLPLHRLDQGDGFYLVAWDRADPAGHAYLALTNPPELQDVYVLPELRRRGVATSLPAAAEGESVARGFDRLTLSVDVENGEARGLYERLGYLETGAVPVRRQGTIMLRGEPFRFDATLAYLSKRLEPGSG
ncbi:MAG: GNAT family N-acetyltransferase [Gaiellaceae bacterium]